MAVIEEEEQQEVAGVGEAGWLMSTARRCMEVVLDILCPECLRRGGRRHASVYSSGRNSLDSGHGDEELEEEEGVPLVVRDDRTFRNGRSSPGSKGGIPERLRGVLPPSKGEYGRVRMTTASE